MTYTFKFWEELGWAVLVGVVVQAANILVDFRPEAVTDWRAWAIAGAGAVARAAAAAVIAAFARR